MACGQTHQSAPVTECYRFDQAYFHWIWQPGRQLVVDSSALIELRPTPMQPAWSLAPGERTPLEVRIPGMVEDSVLTAMREGASFWRPLSADSIEVWWYDGLSGPTFRLARRGDSLVGMMEFKTDVGGELPVRRPAAAARVRCVHETP